MLKMFKRKSSKNKDASPTQETAPKTAVVTNLAEMAAASASVVEITSSAPTESTQASISEPISEAAVVEQPIIEQSIDEQPIAINLKETDALVSAKSKITPFKMVFTALLILFIILTILGTGFLLFGVYVVSIWH